MYLILANTQSGNIANDLIIPVRRANFLCGLIQESLEELFDIHGNGTENRITITMIAQNCLRHVNDDNEAAFILLEAGAFHQRYLQMMSSVFSRNMIGDIKDEIIKTNGWDISHLN